MVDIMIPVKLPFAPDPKPLEVTEWYRSYMERPDRVLIRYDIIVENFTDSGPHVAVSRSIFPVIGETEASWFFDDYGRRRHVLKGSGKRFAHLSDDDALFSLRTRTRWRQSHAHWALTKAHLAIDAYNEIFGGDKPLGKAGTL